MEAKVLDTGDGPVRVALVDDHEVVLHGFADTVAQLEGYAVALALQDARELDLAMPEAERPHLAIVDMCMPHMDGEATIRAMRLHWPGTRVVGMSVDRSPETMQRAFRAGACGFLPKSIRRQQLFEALESVRRRGHYHDDELLREHLNAGVRPTDMELESKLSARERQVLDCVCDPEEYTWKAVADLLVIEHCTVDTHRHNLYGKLRVKSKAGLVCYGRLHGYGKGLYWKPAASGSAAEPG